MSMIDESESKYPTREMWAVKGPDGWKLVPCLPTLEMQKAYFESIDKHMHRVETDLLFWRFDNQRIAYTKMLDAAPEVPGHGCEQNDDGCEQCDDHDFDGGGEEGARG